MAATPNTPIQLSHTSATLWAPADWPAGNATDGNSVPNSTSTLVGLNNSGASTRTVNVRVTRQVDGLSLASTARQYSLAAGEVKLVGLGSIADYGQTVLFTPSHAEVKIQSFAL